MPGKITFISGLYQGKEVHFNSSLDIGRSEANDLVLPFPGISRNHVRIKMEGKTAVLKDLKSQNGTFVNGKIVSGEIILNDGDIIKISSFELRYNYIDEIDEEKIAGKKQDLSFLEESSSTGFINLSDFNFDD